LQIKCFKSADEEAPYFQPDNTLSLSVHFLVPAFHDSRYYLSHVPLSGPQAQGNFTNPQHNDPGVAFWKKANETDSFLDAITSKCMF